MQPAIRDSAYVALFAAITAVLGLVPRIDLGLTVPITAQSMSPMLAGSILGAKRGFLALALFLLLVAAGLPLLAGGRGGMAYFFGPSAGYLWSWPFAAALIGWLTQQVWQKLTFFKSLLINIMGGILLVHACGIPVLAYVNGLTLQAAFLADLYFIPGDLLKAALAAAAAMFVKRGYPLIN